MQETISGKGGGIRMKRGWKLFWIICGSCVGIGLICCMAALIMGVTIETIEDRFPNGFSIPFHTTYHISGFVNDDDYEEDDRDDVPFTEGDDLQVFRNVESIDLYVCAGRIEVICDEEVSDEIRVETKNIDKRLKLKYYMDGDELKIKTRKNIINMNHVKGSPEILIYVPRDFQFKEAEFDLKAGSLYIEDIRAEELCVDVGAGEADINRFTAGEVDFNCGTGSIITSGDVKEKADIDCGIGQITFTANGKQSDYNYEITCGIGEVVCGQSTYSGIGCDEKINNHAAKEMNIECGIGEVNVNFSDEL